MSGLNGALENSGIGRLKFTVGFLATLVMIAGVGCSKIDDVEDTVVATYENGAVTSGELERWLTVRNLPKPPADLRPEIEELVLVRLLAASAVDHGLDDDPSNIFKLQNAEDVLLERALKRRTAESITVPPDEVDTIVAQNLLAFDKPRRARLRNLFKRYPPDASEQHRADIRRRMEILHEQITNGSDIATLALTESDSETRYRGGLMGTVEEGQLPPSLDTIVMSLGAGEVSEIIESRDGLTIILCEAVFEEQRHTIDEVRSKVEANLVRKRRRQAVADLEAELLAVADLEVFVDRALDLATLPDQIIASFGEQNITRMQLEELAKARRRGGRVRQLNETQARAILESYTITATAAERARRLGLTGDELAITAQIDQQVLLATEELGRRVRMQFVEPTETVVREYYEANRGKFSTLPEIDLEMIRFPFTPDSQQEVHRRARRALDAISSDPTRFRTIAPLHAGEGGFSILTLTTRQLAGYGPVIGKAVQSLRTGEASGLIRQDNDFWIIKIVARRTPRQLEFEEVADLAHKRLGQRRVDEIRTAIETEIVNDLGIVLVDKTNK